MLWITALLAYLNERSLHFPTTVALPWEGALASPPMIGWAARAFPAPARYNLLTRPPILPVCFARVAAHLFVFCR